MSKDFGFSFDSNSVDSSLFDSGAGSSYPIIVWHGKYVPGGAPSGFWTLDRAEAEEAPGPFWEAGEVQFGNRPDSPKSPVWKTERLRACVLAVRKRVIIFGEDGSQYTYPWLTKKTDRVSGSYKAHFQVAVTLPGTGDRIFQISLKGLAKTTSWGNPESGPYRNSKFPTGVELGLRDYAKAASKALGATVPDRCTFWIDLVPVLNERGEKSYIDLGRGTFVSAFTASFDLKDSGLETRFVGMPQFLRNQELRQKELLDWEKAWDKPGSERAFGGKAEVDPYDEPVDAFNGIDLKGGGSY